MSWPSYTRSKHKKTLFLHLRLWKQTATSTCAKDSEFGWWLSWSPWSPNTEEAAASDRQKENLCSDIKTNKMVISHRHKQTQARRLVRVGSLWVTVSARRIVHVCALFHMLMCYLTASHILIFRLMRGEKRGGSALRCKLISCWKMLFTLMWV